MSLDKVLVTKGDDRVLTPSNLTCGNQSDLVYDKYMVRNIPFSDVFEQCFFNIFTVILTLVHQMASIRGICTCV